MRNISPEALEKIASNRGSEPITILEIEWVRGTKMYYADRTIEGIRGTILSVGALDSIVSVDNNSETQSISIVLSDIDSEIKDIMDNSDIHLRDVWVYQYFEELDLSDKFLLFKGKINSPLEWKEGERTVSFTVVSQIEDREVGFSAEEGQFEDLPIDLIGKPWPMCFGTVIHNQALRITQPVTGLLITPLGRADAYLEEKARLLEQIGKYYTYAYTDPSENPFLVQSIQYKNITTAQQSTSNRNAVVHNWQVFEQEKVLKLKIDGTPGFEGIFHGELLEITKFSAVGTGHIVPPRVVHTGDPSKIIGYRTVQDGPPYYSLRFIPVYEQKVPTQVVGSNSGYRYYKPGSKVELDTEEPQTYVVSLVPGVVERVTTWVSSYGRTIAADIGPDDYTVGSIKLGDEIEAVTVVLKDALSKNPDIQMSDDIYVTFKSDVGPNTVDIIIYLIEKYTDFNIDSNSFNHVKDRVSNFPSNFSINNRPGILQLLRDICWQSRCSLTLKNDTFYLKYLPEEPTPVASISKRDIIQNTLSISSTDTEDLITKLVGDWKISGMQSDPFKCILRNNIKKYGTKEFVYDMFTYNIQDYILKSLTFWMIRMSNTWKIVSFSTPLTMLNVETLDEVLLDLKEVSNEPIICKVLKAEYDSETRLINFELWCPVKFGSMDPYIFAYPADLPVTELYPTEQEFDPYDLIYLWKEPNTDMTFNKGGDTIQFGPQDLITGVSWKGPIDPTMDEWEKQRLAGDNKTTFEKNGVSDVSRTSSDIGELHPSDSSSTSQSYTWEDVKGFDPSNPGPDSPTSNDPVMGAADQLTGESVPGPSSPGGSGGKDPKEYNEDDAGANQGDDSSDGADGDGQADFNPEDLPHPDDLDPEDWPCRIDVTLDWATNITVVSNPYSTKVGACGTIGAATIVPQRYTFENNIAACSFYEAKRAEVKKTGCNGGPDVLYSITKSGLPCKDASYADNRDGCTDGKAKNEYGMIGFDGAGLPPSI